MPTCSRELTVAPLWSSGAWPDVVVGIAFEILKYRVAKFFRIHIVVEPTNKRRDT